MGNTLICPLFVLTSYITILKQTVSHFSQNSSKMAIKYNYKQFFFNKLGISRRFCNKKKEKKSERISLRKLIYRHNCKPFRRASFQTKNIISSLQFLMLLIPLLPCLSSSSVIKNEFKNGFDKQWTKKLLFLRLFSTILLISHSPLPPNYLRFHFH